MKLSPQQKLILEHFANGERVNDISKIMKLSKPTVHLHTRALKDNLGALTTNHAVAIAIRKGLIE